MQLNLGFILFHPSAAYTKRYRLCLYLINYSRIGYYISYSSYKKSFRAQGDNLITKAKLANNNHLLNSYFIFIQYTLVLS